MGYIAFRVDKIKTTSGLSITRSHNQREGYCENADASRKFMNRQLMPCASDYATFVNERISACPAFAGGKKHPREDAVKAIELIFRVGAEEMAENPHFDLDRFCDITKKWVCDKFGKENVADLVLHMDEGYGEHNGSLKCAPHIHAVIVPITKDGRLSASDFVGSPKKLQALQSEVAAQYKELRLKRGLKGSVATPHEMKEFYGWVHAARTVDLPEPGEHETARQYAIRIKPEFQKIQSQNLDILLKTQRERDEVVTKLQQLKDTENTAADEIKRKQEELEKRAAELDRQAKTLQKEAETLQRWKDLYRGLSSVKIPKEARDVFNQVANIAWTEGRAAREAEELELTENHALQAGMHGESK